MYFNGAAIDRSRKCAHASARFFLLCTSMGPRSIDRGNRAKLEHAIDDAMYFNGAAIDRSRKCWCLLRLATRKLTSMGPRSIDRGNIARRPAQRVDQRTSMGPRSIDRGNAALARAPVMSCGYFNGAAIDRSRK